MLIAQISDCHIVEPGELFADRIDSAAGLRRAIESINALERQPDLVLATGDLVNDGAEAQYDHLAELLGALAAPVFALMGNHDDREQFQRVFGRPAAAGSTTEPLDHTLTCGPMEIITLDTSIPGDHAGRLTAAQLDWLDHELSRTSGTPVMVAQHHPPFATGISWMDETCGFDGAAEEAAVLARYDHVELVTCGHIHRAMHRRFAGTLAMTCPSTAAALHLDLSDGSSRYSTEPPAYALHEWVEGRALMSHIVTVGDHETWQPSWATADDDPIVSGR